jgi:hypothetical protein
MYNLPLIVPDDQVIAIDQDYFTALDADFLCRRSMGRSGFLFYLRAHAYREDQVNSPHRKHRPNS